MPAIPFYKIVRSFATANGFSFTTVKQQTLVIRVYREIAAKLN